MTDTPDLKAPKKTLKLGEREFSMPYAMLMDICRLLPNPGVALEMILFDNTTQDYVVRRLLTPAEKEVENEADLIRKHEVDLDSDEISEVLQWAGEHVLYFFAKRSLGLRAMGAQFQKTLPPPSGDGSGASPSTEPSAGPLA